MNAWLIEAGLLDIAHGDPIGLVVETGCRYAAPLAYPRAGRDRPRRRAARHFSVTYRLGVFAKGAEDAAAEGHFTHVYVGRESRRPVALPEAWRAKLEAIRLGD